MSVIGIPSSPDMQEKKFSEAQKDTIYRKVTWRIMPLLFLGLIAANIDRMNVAYAKSQLEATVGIGDLAYGFGVSIFFIGYILTEVPSNMLMHKFGPRVWLTRIMISWGLITASMMFVQGPIMFYVLRFFLGVAEAGFIPGVLVLLAQWYPPRRRSFATGLFLAAMPLSGVIGGPIAGWILDPMNGVAGLHGWQWLFLLEGTFTLLLGAVFVTLIRNTPEEIRWLTPAEKSVIKNDLAVAPATKSNTSFLDALREKRVLMLGLLYIFIVLGNAGITFWLPQLIMNSGVESSSSAAWLSALPWLVTTVVMLFTTKNSDRTGDRKWHIVTLSLVSVVGWAITIVFQEHTAFALLGLSLAAAGVTSCVPLILGMPSRFMSAMALAAGVAAVHAFGNIGTMIAPSMIGVVVEVTGTPTAALWVMGAAALIAALGVLFFLPKDLARDPKVEIISEDEKTSA